jgi:hypothetical protein
MVFRYPLVSRTKSNSRVRTLANATDSDLALLVNRPFVPMAAKQGEGIGGNILFTDLSFDSFDTKTTFLVILILFFTRLLAGSTIFFIRT